MSGPRIYLISRPSLDLESLAKFLADEQVDWRRTADAEQAEELIELAGRICYMSFGDSQSDRTNSKYIQNLIRQGHESVLEHATWSFILTGVSRAFSHQFVRHRVGFAYSQLSQQYHDERHARLVVPEPVRQSEAAWSVWESVETNARAAYEKIIDELEKVYDSTDREDRRLIRSAARGILPNATETKIFFTANTRAIRHFLETRGAILGDTEMRAVSALLLDNLKEEAPSLFKDFHVTVLPDGSPVVRREEPS